MARESDLGFMRCELSFTLCQLVLTFSTASLPPVAPSARTKCPRLNWLTSGPAPTAPPLVARFRQHPFVTATGPRQSGKTMLCRAAFPGLPHVDLDAPVERVFAESGPEGRSRRSPPGAHPVRDPAGPGPAGTYLKVLAEERGGTGLFIRTGSEPSRLLETIDKSLAGPHRASECSPKPSGSFGSNLCPDPSEQLTPAAAVDN